MAELYTSYPHSTGGKKSPQAYKGGMAKGPLDSDESDAETFEDEDEFDGEDEGE